MDEEKPPARMGRGVILAAVVIAQMADLVTLYAGSLVVSMDAELNPFIRAQYAAGGFEAVATVKVALTAAMVAFSAVLLRFPLPPVRVFAAVPVSIGWFGALMNLSVLVAASA